MVPTPKKCCVLDIARLHCNRVITVSVQTIVEQ
jgi:hypothetical protein